MLGFQPISGAPISARRDLSTAQPGDPFNLTDGLDESLETLDLDAGQLSFYQQLDDDVAAVLDLTLTYILDVTFDEADEPVSFYQANEDDPVVAPETLPISFDLDEVIDQDSPDLSFYQQLDDDAVVAQPDALFGSFEYADDTGIFDDDTSFYSQLDDDPAVAQPDALLFSFDLIDDVGISDDGTSFYQQLDDDAAAQPDALLGSFDYLDDAGLFDDATSFYYQADDDAVVVTPPVTTAGGVAKHYILSGEKGRKSEREPEPKPYRQPFEVTLAKPPIDLKALSDRLFDLGKQLGKNKQAVKDRIKAEQAAQTAAKDAKLAVILQLIQLFELELYNQNARRLLLILAEDRA